MEQLYQYIIDIDSWDKVQSDDKETFAKFVNCEATVQIRRGDEWPDEIDVEINDEDGRRTIAQRELMHDALHVAESFMRSYTAGQR